MRIAIMGSGGVGGYLGGRLAASGQDVTFIARGAHLAALIAAPGVIRHTGIMARFLFGELDGAHSERIAALSAALDKAGVDHQVSEDIERDIWGKMVFLATFAGLT